MRYGAGGWHLFGRLADYAYAWSSNLSLAPGTRLVAELTASTVLYLTAFVIAAPISTTQVMIGSVMGVGSTRRLSAVRWGVAREIGMAWILTLPAAATIAALAYPVFMLLTPR